MSLTTSDSADIYYFKEVLSKVGISLQYDENPNIYQKEECFLIRDIQKELEKHPNFPQSVAEFISGLKHLTKKQKLLKKALQPSQLQQITENESTVIRSENSLFRTLLSIDCIQTEVISVVLEEVTAHAIEDEQETSWLRLLLCPLRCLSYIKDSHQITTNLLEILEVATYQAQLDILDFISVIIPDSEHDKTAKHLTKILNENPDLTCAIIDCLNDLNLSVDTKDEIQDYILAILNSTLSLQTLSIIFCFLVNNCKQTNLQNILLKTRNALDSIMMCQNENEDHESEHVLVFNNIREKSSKVVCEGWINLINSIRNSNDHKCVDILILLMLRSSGKSKHQIETIFKKKIKSRQFKLSLLETAFQKHLTPQTLRQYIQSILEIAAFLLRIYSDPLYLQFVTIFYTTTFCHKYADNQLRQQILNSLIQLTGTKEGNKAIPALSILETIAEKHLKILQPHTMQLMGLLDRIEQTDLGEVKQIFDLLCSLTCGPNAPESSSGFRYTIHIIAKKQLSGTVKSIYRGIIAAVATAKNIAAVLKESESALSEDSYTNISDLPNECAKEAASLLEFTKRNTLNCPIARGLYYDQLAQMILTMENLDSHFMAWLFDTITLIFQEDYLSDQPTQSINDIPISIQYNLNSNEELDTPIAVKLAELTITSKENNNTMLVFAPLFRLLRLIHFRQHNGNLTTIDALLGCGIALPDIDPDVGIDSFDSDQSKQVVNCLFHCINWFREIISAFVTQKDKKMKQKILKRLEQLIELEELFLNCMKLMPDHKLPPCYFYNINLDSSSNVSHDSTKITEKGRKRRAAPTQNMTATKLTIGTQPVASTSRPGRKPQNKEKEAIEFQFREMDTDIMLLLKHPLIIEGESSPEQELRLSLSQYKFIMKDLVMKLNSVTKPNSQSILTHLVTVKPKIFIEDCVRLMPHINKHLIKISEEIKKLLKRCDGIHDSHEMFIAPAIELKLCFSLTLELQALVLNWTVFQTDKNLPLLREYLRACIEDSSSQLKSAQNLIIEYLKYIMKLVDYCLTLPCAVHLINIVQALCNVTNDDTPKKKKVLLSGNLLSMRWFNLSGFPETGATANLHIDSLVKSHLYGSNLETISSVISWIQSESSKLKSKDDNLATFPSITKANFPILYRGACATLLEALQNELHGLTNTEHLEVWLTTVTTMRSLMDIVKSQENRTNLSAFLKKSSAILKVFLSQGLPILEIMLCSHSDQVVEILRTLQQTTRFLHNLCCHSKVTKDSALIAHVPQMRLTLETLVYRVKAALVANNCTSAFWMGNLRNKNLHGSEIMSQSTNESANEQQDCESEEDLPADDSESETVLSATQEGNDDESSGVF